jgi:hypothetical protein
MRIRLTRKLALTLNGIAVSDLQDGEEVELSERSAQMLVLGGWAHPLPTSKSSGRKSVRSTIRGRDWSLALGRD